MTDRPVSSEELLARFRAGDPDAFRRLVAPHLPVLRARANRWLDARLRKKVSVRDVVQEAQLVAFERRGDFEARDPTSLRRWLFGIVDNCARDVIQHFAGTQKRSPQRELTGDHRPATAALRGHGPSPSRAMIDREREQLLRDARTHLSSPDQEILRLVHDDKLTLREVAARVDRPYEAVKKQHGRAVLRLGEVFRRLRHTSHD